MSSLFATLPKAASLARVGVVDIGSNSVRLVVFDGESRNPEYFFNEKVMCGLGKGIGSTHRLHPEGRERAMRALARFQALAYELGTGQLIAVATAAVRDALDGPAFCAEVRAQLGLDITVVSGEEEAELSAMGVMMGRPTATGIVCDLGGASMEIAEIFNGEIISRQTSPLGPLQLMEFDTPKARAREITAHVKRLKSALLRRSDEALYLVGGSWRAFARVDMERRRYPLHVLHEYELEKEHIKKTNRFLKKKDLEVLRKACGVSEARMALVPIASEVLVHLHRHFGPRETSVSAFGLREGVLYTQLPPKLRNEDPLIFACQFAEEKYARLPGFGNQLYTFISPLFVGCDAHVVRLVLAASLINDVSWRTHPDFRAQACFDFITRSNMAQLSHRDRAFLALALIYRYRTQTHEMDLDPYLGLLSPQQRDNVEILGRALRFGAMFMLRHPRADLPARLHFDPAARTLILTLRQEAQVLFSEAAEQRLNSLAKAMQAEVSVVME